MRVFSNAALSLLVLFATSWFAHAGDPFDAQNSSKASESSQRRTWIDADSDATEGVLKALDSKLSSAGLDFTETPLEDAVVFIHNEYGIEYCFEDSALDDIGLGRDHPVDVSFSNVRLGAALRLMLQPHQLDYYVTDGVLVLTSRDAAVSRLATAIYDVAELTRDSDDYDLLIETIVATIAVQTWAEMGGGAAEIRPYARRGAIVISQTTENHEQIRALLDGLCEYAPREIVESKATKAGDGGGGGFGFGFGSGGFSGGGMGWGGSGNGVAGAKPKTVSHPETE